MSFHKVFQLICWEFSAADHNRTSAFHLEMLQNWQAEHRDWTVSYRRLGNKFWLNCYSHWTREWHLSQTIGLLKKGRPLLEAPWRKSEIYHNSQESDENDFAELKVWLFSVSRDSSQTDLPVKTLVPSSPVLPIDFTNKCSMIQS